MAYPNSKLFFFHREYNDLRAKQNESLTVITKDKSLKINRSNSAERFIKHNVY